MSLRLFRVENGKVAEHWDTIETIPPHEQWKNGNGKFGDPFGFWMDKVRPS